MKKPDRHDFVEERKIDGKLYKSINEDHYRTAMRKFDKYMRELHRNTKMTR